MGLTERLGQIETGPDLEAALARAKLQATLFEEASFPTVGRFTLLGKIGAGGMGAVYAAYDHELDRRVAIKLLHEDAPEAERLAREAEALAALNHPNVVPIFGTGTAGDRRFIVMELVEGETLSAWHLGAHSLEEILDLYLQIAEGLSAAHAAEIVHRDLKPQNVIVGTDGRPRILDFGLARAEPAEPSTLPPTLGSPGSRPRITRDGAIVGTVAYMAPEQFHGRPATPASDQYAFALCLWEAAYRRPAFPTRSVLRLIDARDAGKVDEFPAGPAWLRNTLQRCLSPDPFRRFPSMRALCEHLHRHRTRRRRRWLVAGAGVAVLALAGVELIAPVDEMRCEPDPAALADAWGPARRAEVQEALDSAGAELHATATEVLAGLDEQAVAWQAAWTAACRAAPEHDPSLDQRMACLRRRRGELEALSAVLSGADSEVVANARHAINRLRDPAACAEPDREAEVVPPDPTCATEVEALRVEVAAATALNDVGKHDQARARAEGLPRVPLSCEYPAVRAEAHFALAQTLHRLGDERGAQENFGETFWAATQAGQDALAVEAASLLLEAMVVGDTDLDDAEHWRRTAEAALTRVPEPAFLRSELLMRYGRLLMHYGQWRESVQHLGEAIELRRRAVGAHDATMTFLLSYYAMSSARIGALEEAKAHHAEAVEIAEETLGANHTDITRLLVNAAQTDVALGALEDAIAKLERGLRILDASGSSSPYTRGAVLQALAETTNWLGQPERALEYAHRSVDVLADHHNDPKLLAALFILARLQLQQQDLEGALATGSRALEELRAGTSSIRAFSIYAINADIHHRLEHPEQAASYLVEAEAATTGQEWEQWELMRQWCRTSTPERALAHGDRLQNAAFRYEFAQCLWDAELDRRRALEMASASLEAIEATPQKQVNGVGPDAIRTWLEERTGDG